MNHVTTHKSHSQGNLSETKSHSVISGLLTSQAAGLVMAVVVMVVFTVFLGKGPLYPVQVIGSTIFGEDALVGFNFSAFLAGLVLHQSVALAWGIVFTILAITLKVQTVKQSLILGVVVAVVSMVDTYFFVPAVMIHFHGVDIWNREVPIFWNWAAHLVFGLSYGLYPVILSKLYSQRS
ncbi:MAG: hypothetical protein NVS3B3_01260 [Aquirhabdus sp.]